MVAECLLVLRKAIPSMEIDPELASHFLQDMDEEELRDAVVLVIQHQSEIYPNMPWIALLREAKRRWCSACEGTGKVESSVGYEIRCACRRKQNNGSPWNSPGVNARLREQRQAQEKIQQ